MNYWFSGAVVIGILAACWSYVKTLVWRTVSLFVVRLRIEDSLAEAVAYYCWKHFQRSKYGERQFGSSTEFVRPLDRYQAVGYEVVGQDPVMFWAGWIPMLVGWNRFNQSSDLTLTITFLRGTFVIQRLLIAALDEFNEHRHGNTENAGSRFRIRRCAGRERVGSSRSDALMQASPRKPNEIHSLARRFLKWNREDLGAYRGDKDPFQALAYDQGVADALQYIQRWLASERWYKTKRIPWRLGLLLYGPPGTGKTSFVRAMAQLLDLPVFSFDLAGFDNRDMVTNWETVLGEAPCVVLMEDVDAVFKGRENRLGEAGGGLTFDCLLNCIGGVQEANGLLLTVTTNRLEDLDYALTRPGRLDLAVELSALSERCRRQLAQRILEDCPDEIEPVVAAGAGDTGARFQNRCEQVALARYWNCVETQRNGTGTPGAGCYLSTTVTSEKIHA